MAIPCMNGKILVVDLTNERVEEKPIPDEMVGKYLGSRGIAAKILWDETNKDTDPLGPDNVLIISVGTLLGTTAPCVGRVTVTTKGPATNMYLKSSTGGRWGSRLKSAGYDILVIKGKAERPVYLLINKNDVQFKDASHLWGKTTRDTIAQIKGELPGKGIEVACVGPAGENGVVFAGILFSEYDMAARGGTGAVMGSKNLKAIVAGPETRRFPVAEPEKFKEVVKRSKELIKNDTNFAVFSTLGTNGFLEALCEMGLCPTQNYREGPFKGAKYLGTPHIKESGYLKKMTACETCIIGCKLATKYPGGYAGGPEMETAAALGVGLLIDDLEAVLKGNELCWLYGLDTISTGRVIQWAVESFERGVITKEDTDGMELNWGDGNVMLEMIKKMAYRVGIGNLLADGIARASEKVGKDSYKWAVQARGLEQSNCDTRMAKGYGLAFALNPRGPDHLHTEIVAEFGGTLEGVERIKKITGSEDYAKSYLTEKRPEIVQWHEDCYAATDSLGLCAFVTTAIYAFTPVEMAELFKYATGIDMDEEKLMKAGERIVTLEQCYNIKLGKTREWHKLPWRVMNEEPAVEPGTLPGTINTQQELDDMLDKYFELRKWDKETTVPYMSTLESLSLKEIGEELKRRDIKVLP